MRLRLKTVTAPPTRQRFVAAEQREIARVDAAPDAREYEGKRSAFSPHKLQEVTAPFSALRNGRHRLRYRLPRAIRVDRRPDRFYGAKEGYELPVRRMLRVDRSIQQRTLRPPGEHCAVLNERVVSKIDPTRDVVIAPERPAFGKQ